ncbi:MAG TPA: hypothetical protein VNL71_21455, partial [Chloroflexota bacterium]|nr:hypothetical protein [Chloroflexota bacterium]
MLDNLEQLIDACNSGGIRVDGWAEPNGGARGSFGYLISEYFRTTRPEAATAYQSLGQIVTRGDVILTFNYDISLEVELGRTGKWYLNDGYGFQIREDGPTSPTKILKLHGSANWQASIFGGSKVGQFQPDSVTGPGPTFSPFACRELGFANYSDARFVGGGVVVYLILPTLRKEFFW